MNVRTMTYAMMAALALTAGRQKAGLSESEKAAKVDSRHDRRKLIEEWRNALSRIPVERLSPSDRYGVLREVGRMLVWDLVDAQLDMGGTYGEMREGYFKAVEWLDVQCARMRALASETCCDCRAWRDRWSYYQALAEYREVVVENVGLNGLDERRHPNDVDKMDAIRARFEKLIGRPVRRGEDVKLLGFYRRRGGSRTQKEREAQSSAIRERE